MVGPAEPEPRAPERPPESSAAVGIFCVYEPRRGDLELLQDWESEEIGKVSEGMRKTFAFLFYFYLSPSIVH